MDVDASSREHRPCTDCGSKGQPLAEGRALPARGGLHLRTHPTYVEGCFGCKVMTQSASLPGHASARGDGISQASALKVEHEARAKADPDRYAPAKTRAYFR